ncbi:MAG: undecaprenyldiphospho-muramoylpentapeptide beta-N-acetylglucosaminyltransferase [Elusimicrobiota bacterium]
MNKKVLIAVSSTGGHIYPGIAVADELKKNGYDVFFVDKGGQNSEIILKAGYRFYKISASGLKRKISYSNIAFFPSFIYRFLFSIYQSFKILKKEQPGIVIGFGSYISVSVILAASIRKIPSIVHEQNIIPGFANKISAVFANTVCIGFEKTKTCFPAAKVILTGNPVRQEIRNINPSPFTLHPLPFTCLIFGGSQGAHSINLAIVNAIDKFLLIKEKIHLIHITGEKDYEIVKNTYTTKKISAEVHKYLFNIETAYKKASVIISRAGAMTITELITVKIPALLVPYPYSTERHQKANADYLAENGCAVVIEENEIHKLVDKLLELLNQPETLQKMTDAYLKIAYPDATKTFCQLVKTYF